MDETPLFLNMPKTRTIIKKGAKQVIVGTQGQEKCRISVILSIIADGEKLPPIIIFKAKDKGKVFKSLNEDINVKKGLWYIEWNSNAWATEDIIQKWLKQIWFKYLESPHLLSDGMGYLILDNVTSHFTENIIAKYTNDYKFMVFIPSGLTIYLQPLYVVVNKLFKEAIKKLYVEYFLEVGIENTKVSRNKIIEMIIKVWWDQ